MGYYIQLTFSDFEIAPENLDEAYKRMCDLNKRDDLKGGGRWGPGGVQEAKWFAWMPENYPETCKDAKEVLEALGFETSSGRDGTLRLDFYDKKIGDENLFLETIADLATGTLEWRGEEGDQWRTTFPDFETKNARVVWDDE